MRKITRPQVVEDLREKLNRKRQERQKEDTGDGAGAAGETKNNRKPPPDPPSILRDRLRGDEDDVNPQANKSDYQSRGRGGRGRRFSRRRPWGTRPKPSNIVVEFSNPGERTCTIDETSQINMQRGRGGYRNRRNFRPQQRSRSYRGGSRRGHNFETRNENVHHDNNLNRIVPVDIHDTEELWDDVNEVRSNVVRDVAGNLSSAANNDDYDNTKERESEYESVNEATDRASDDEESIDNERVTDIKEKLKS